jgi:hypothetical protein
MSGVSLEMLQSLVQQVLDGQKLLRDDVRNVRLRLGRIEHGIATVQSALVDRLEGETGMQEQIDGLAARVERLEQR